MSQKRVEDQGYDFLILRWWLTERRRRLNYSWEDVAEIAETTPHEVQKWAEGQGLPNRDQLFAVARHLRDPDHPPGAEPLPEASIEENEFVVASNGLGIGKCLEVRGETATVEYFDTVAERVEHNISVDDLRVVRLAHQTRCYVYSEELERWRMGRVKLLRDRDRIIEFPDQESARVEQENLYVRWARPVGDPIETLKQKGQETVFFRNKREPFVRALLKQRSASRGASGLLSSSINLYPHQVEVVRRVLEDPIQRYLLADEVGLGKTIEAGVIIRQFLIDHDDGDVWIFVPPTLCRQWRREMDNKFALGALDGEVRVFGIDELPAMAQEGTPDVVVIDEAHRVAGWAQADRPQTDFEQAASLSHRAERLLLLSATPAHQHEEEYLAMLHLLDPEIYALDDTEAFRKRIQRRDEVGALLRDLVEGEDAFPLELALDDLRDAFPDDPQLNTKADDLEKALASDPVNAEQRDTAIRDLRLQLKERYRLHHRMLRSRREEAAEHIDTGRTAPTHPEFGLDGRENQIHELLETWRLRALRTLEETTEEMDRAYVSIFQHLVEVAGSSLPLLADVLQLRLDEDATDRVERDFSEDQRHLLKTTPFLDGEVDVLQSMQEACTAEMEEFDVDHAGWLKMFVDSHLDPDNPSQTAVVFASYTSVAERIHSRLAEAFGDEAVAAHLQDRPPERVEEEVLRFKQNPVCRILVCDKSGEEGRNFQFARHLVHFDLPLAPNRIEQRAGRLDRIGRGEQPMQNHVYIGPEVEGGRSLFEAWYDILANGFRVFDESIAGLQFFVEDIRPRLVRGLLQNGGNRIGERIEKLRSQIDEERDRLKRQQEFEELEVYQGGAHTHFEELEELESQGGKLRKQIDNWITRALQFHRSQRQYPEGTFRYEPDFRGKTLVPFDTILNRFLPRSEKPTTYRRSVAVDGASGANQPATMFRIGHPFLDELVDYFEWDDRGRAYAIWRTSENWAAAGGQDELYFRFEFVVEADVSHALNEVEGEHGQGAALQRRADAYFPPRFETVFIDRHGELVKQSGIRSLLAKDPHRRQDGGPDENIKGDRVHVLDDFIDPLDWRSRCQTARETAEEALRQSESLAQGKHEGRRQAERDGRDRVNRLRLRAGAPEERSEAQHYDRLADQEESVSKALLQGIEDPIIRLDSVGVIVLSGSTMPRNDE